MSIGSRIRQIRESHHMTQEELAAAAGVSKSFVSDLENDKRSPGTAYLLKFAEALQVSVEYLAKGEGTSSAARRDGAVIPIELEKAALKLNLTYAQTLDLLHAHDRILAHNSDDPPKSNFDYWRDLANEFHERWSQPIQESAGN